MNNGNSVLSTSFDICKTTIKNRFVMCAMGGIKFYNIDGSPADNAYSFYIERAKGGIGLIITRAIIVKPIGLSFNLYDKPEIFEPTKKLTNEIHKYGAKIFMQLSAGAGRTLHSTVEQMEMRGISKYKAFFAPSDNLPNFWYPEIKHRALTNKEIKDYIKAFANVAKIAKNCGFDGIEIHALHEGYLLDQFAMKCTNYRTDEYGGSLENRFRFPCEIIEAIKEKCGFDFPVIIRYSVSSKMIAFNKGTLQNFQYEEYGRSVEESIKGAEMLEKAGCDAFDVDNGSYDSWFWAHPPVYMPNACNATESKLLKSNVNVPVICAGKMDLSNCYEYIKDNTCDAIGIARALLVDPNYVNKTIENDIESIKPCIGCHVGCLGAIQNNFRLGCALNPNAYPNNDYKWSKVCENQNKEIAIIGAGIAGMEAAIQLKKLGYSVKIYEKENRIGGVFVSAAAFSFKERDKLLLDWYAHQIEINQIPVEYNTFVDKVVLENLKENIIICATGAKKKELLALKAHSEYAIDFLNNKNEDKFVDNTIIIGGGLTGCEIAYEIAKKGKKAIIIEAQDQILNTTICEANKQFLLSSLEKFDVGVYTGVNDIKNNNNSLIFVSHNKNCSIRYNKIVIANGYLPNPIFDDYPQMFGEKTVYYIGDAEKVGNLQSAVHSAYSVVSAINSQGEKNEKC